MHAIDDFFQSVAISPQHLSAANYNFSSNESIGDQFMFDKIDSSTDFAHRSAISLATSNIAPSKIEKLNHLDPLIFSHQEMTAID